MTLVRTPCPMRLPLGVNVQNDPRDFAPVGAVRIGIEHVEIGDEMLFVARGERGIGGCEIDDIGGRLYTSRSSKYDGVPT